MSDTSTTDENDQANSDAASTDTSTDSTSTDSQTAASDDLDGTSKSTDSSADGDKSTANEDGDDAPASPKLDEDIVDWAEKRGLKPPETDAEKAAVQTLRDEQREYTKSRQADKATKDAQELSKEVQTSKPELDDEDDDIDPVTKRQDKIESDMAAEKTTRLQSEFYSTNSVTPEQHKALLDIYKEKVSSPATPEAKQRAFEIWSDPSALPDLLDLANARMAKGSDPSAVADEAARKERERIARESQANSPGRGAKSTTSGNKTPEQERLDRFSNWE